MDARPTPAPLAASPSPSAHGGLTIVISDIDHTLKLMNKPWSTPPVPGMCALLWRFLRGEHGGVASRDGGVGDEASAAAAAAGAARPSGDDSPTPRPSCDGEQGQERLLFYLTNRYGPLSSLSRGRWSPRRFLFVDNNFPPAPVFQRSGADFFGFVGRSTRHKDAVLDDIVRFPRQCQQLFSEAPVAEGPSEFVTCCSSHRDRLAAMADGRTAHGDDEANAVASTTNSSNHHDANRGQGGDDGARPPRDGHASSVTAPPPTATASRVILLGDSVEKDALIYVNFAERHPSIARIDICIRMVPLDGDAAAAARDPSACSSSAPAAVAEYRGSDEIVDRGTVTPPAGGRGPFRVSTYFEEARMRFEKLRDERLRQHDGRQTLRFVEFATGDDLLHVFDRR